MSLGHCLTGHHHACPLTVHLSQQDRDITCTCSCHEEER